mmetsp:Transcript_115711/g.280770  ORF Transcript_115711/g.280770 Transcript_115711/m.280770 type:complete len:94 (+) Transcript_115711:730-1011(+)
MDWRKEERGRGVTSPCPTRKFCTDKWLYTFIVAPCRRCYSSGMFSDASQADVASILLPADGNSKAAIAKGSHKAGEIQGQTRQRSRLIKLLDV